MAWHKLALGVILSAVAYGQQANLEQIQQQLNQLQQDNQRLNKQLDDLRQQVLEHKLELFFGGALGNLGDYRGSPENPCRSADRRSSAACGSGPFWTAARASSNCCGVAMPTRIVPIAG